MIIWIINRVLLLFSLYKLAERTLIFTFAFLFHDYEKQNSQKIWGFF